MTTLRSPRFAHHVEKGDLNTRQQHAVTVRLLPVTRLGELPSRRSAAAARNGKHDCALLVPALPGDYAMWGRDIGSGRCGECAGQGVDELCQFAHMATSAWTARPGRAKIKPVLDAVPTNP